MLVAEVMTTPAMSIRREAPLTEAIAVLGSQGISAVPVVDERDVVVGILSEADILRQSLPEDPRAHLRPIEPVSALDSVVGEVMTVDPVCVPPHGDCADVAQVLADTGWKSMPVVEDGRLVGMVSRSDILRSLARSDADLTTAVAAAFAAAGHPEWTATVRAGQVYVVCPDADLEAAAVATASTVAGVRGVQPGPGPRDVP